jgi:hypothetical protein
MKAKHSVWKNKLAKTLFFMTVVLVAALFLGTAASAGATSKTTPTQNKSTLSTFAKPQQAGLSSVNYPQTTLNFQRFNPSAPFGEVIFTQTYYTPDESWNFLTSDTVLGYLMQEDFWDVPQAIGDVHWYGLCMLYSGGWTPVDPAGTLWEIKFYEDSGGAPGAEVASFSDLEPTVTDTGLLYGGYYPMWYWEIALDSQVDLAAGWISIQSTSNPLGGSFLWAAGPDGNFNARQNGASTGTNQAYDLTAPDIQYDHDISISTIVKPATGNGAPIDPVVKVKNGGLYTETSVPIELLIGTEVVSGTVEDFEATDGGYTHFPKTIDAWEYGIPTSGPMAAHSGSKLWATILNGAYPNSMWCSLVTPAFTVPSGVMFNFWQWYQFEQGWDGGNVKISTDGGNTWTLITPEGGYPGTLSSNPYMTGQQGYTGTGPGWEKEEFDLSAYEGMLVQIMFETASDGSVTYPGWYIDDVGFTVISWQNVYDQIVYIPSIAPDEVIEVAFPTWTPAEIGTVEGITVNYFAEAYNLFADENAANDYKSKAFSLHYGYFNDVKVNAINSPISGLAEKQTPEVAIENVGQFDQSVNVNMVISKIQYGAQWTQEATGEWQQIFSNIAGGVSPEAYLPYYVIQGDYAYLMSCPIDTSAYSTLSLSFRSMINDYAGGYNCYIKSRSSESDEWTDVTPWANPIYGSISAAQYTVDVTGDISTTTQIMFEFDGYYFNLNYWYIDDFVCGPYSTDFSGNFPPVEVSLISEYDGTTTVDLAAGATMNVTLPQWTPSDLPFSMGIDYQADVTLTLNGFTPVYSYGFENWVPPVPPGPVVFPPAGWNVYNVNGDGVTWTQYTSPHTGTYCASISYHYPTDDDWLATAPIIVPGGGGQFSFWWKCGSTYYAEHFKVYYSTSGNTVADFTGPNGYVIGDITYNADTNWHQFTYTMTNPEQVWFAVYIDSADALRLSVDDFAFPDGSIQGFDEGTPGADGYWPEFSQYYYGTTTPQWFGVTTGVLPTCSPTEGIYMAEYNSWNIYSGNSAELDGTVLVDFSTATQMKFDMYHDSGYNAADVIYPLLSADGVNFWYDGTGFYQYDGTTGWKTETMDYSFLISYLGGPGNYYIGFYAVSDYGYNMFIDDINVNVFSSIPDGNPADNTMSKTFTLSYEHDVGVATITEPSYTPLRTGEVIFHQGYYGPDESWAFDTSGMALGYLVYEDFYGLTDKIGDVAFWGIPLANNGGWIQTDPALLVFDIIFYEDNAGLPGAVVSTFTGLSATFEDTGIQYAGLYEMFKWYVTLPEAVDMTDGWISIQSEIPSDNGNLMWATGPDGNSNAQQLQSGVLVPLGQNMAYDLGKAEVPQGGNWPPGTYHVAGIVKNMGVTYDESNFDVNTQITGPTGAIIYDNTVTVFDILVPQATVTVTFPDITIPDWNTSEGTYKVTMKTMLVGDDHTNNDKKTMTFTIERPDIWPPVTIASISGTMGQNGWYISNPILTLTATDPDHNQSKWPSGVNHTYYKIDNGAYQEYLTPVTLVGEGTHTVSYYSVDKAGNVEDAQTTAPYKVDTVAPVFTNYTFTPLNFMKNKWLCSAVVDDATSGVVLVEFYVDDALVGNATAEPYEFTFNGKPTNSSQALAYDAAGNSALSQVATSMEMGAQQQSYTTLQLFQAMKI